MARLLIYSLLFICASAACARDLSAAHEKVKFKLGKNSFEAYVADNDEKRSEGLMFIEELPKDTGMLFIFEVEQPLSFWMKNTLIPLSIGFFDNKGKLVDIQEMNVASSLMSRDIPTYRSRKPALFALEMNKGWFAKKGIQVGTRLEPVTDFKSPLLKSKLPHSKARQ
jgi:uncharacterized protein